MKGDLISRSALEQEGFTHFIRVLESGRVVKVKKIEDAPAVDAVPVDDMFGEMLNWAVRYSLGRMTYAVSDTVGYVMPLIPKLGRRTLSVMQRDIEEAPSHGMECDKADWMRLLYAIREELKRRTNNAD